MAAAGEDVAAGPDEECGVRFRWLAESLQPPYRDHFPGYTDGMSRGEPGGFFVTPAVGENAAAIRRFQLRADDTWIVTFPKSGTTWTQEMLWMIVNDHDYQAAQRQILDTRSPFLEFPYLLPKELMELPPPETVLDDGVDSPASVMTLTLGVTDGLPSPRLIKSHLPLCLLNPKLLDTCKVVYVARNPKDVIVSYFHHHKLIKFHDFTGDIAGFAEYFMKDELLYSPYFPHVLEAWKLRHHPNMHFIFYEDLKRDLRGGIRKTAEFLRKPVTEEQLDRLEQHLCFDNFAKNPSVNNEYAKHLGLFKQEGNFIRKGKTGDWKNHFGPELNERIDRWIEANLAGTDLQFVTELVE